MSTSDPNIVALVAALTPHLSVFYSAESILQMAQQLARGEQPQVGDQAMLLHMGSHNTITNATIHMGNHTIHVHLPNPETIGQSTAQALLRIKLNALLEHHESSTIFRDRLDGFVGRKQELAEIRQRIAEVQSSGGYVTITGQAGEGKSSVIAQLVRQDGIDQTAFHFIPLVPGREYQLSLLTHFTARLIMKYDLPIEYVPDHSYPLMRNLFQSVLRQLAVRGVKETIYIDGLDQLERDYQNQRDLSFLPEDPPAGIVFVLGTRPDDTLDPLEILKPQHQYRLSPLSFADFEALLAMKQPIAPTLAKQLYDAVKGNALYLSLIGNELISAPYESVDELLALISADPNNIFRITLGRIEGHNEGLWNEILHPLLAVLLVTQEPLHHHTLSAVLNVSNHTIQRALNKLGGLVAQDSGGRSFLYHLTIRDYLQEDEAKPEKAYVFAFHEMIDWHRRLAQWCLKNLDAIWNDDTEGIEQMRRIYARHHTITHLCLGQEYTLLWNLIDDGSYGQHKRQYDPSTRLYALDLDRARDVAMQAKDTLYLWRTTLLRVSLTSTVDTWPDDLFVAYTKHGRAREMMQRIELLSDRKRQILLLCKMIPFIDADLVQGVKIALEGVVDALWKEGTSTDNDVITIMQEQIGIGMFNAAEATARQIKHVNIRSEALRTIVNAQMEAGQINVAEATARQIEDVEYRSEALAKIASAQAQAGAFDAAKVIARQIEDVEYRSEALAKIASAQAEAGQINAAHETWERAATTAGQIEDAKNRASALVAIASAQVQVGAFAAAKVTARQIEYAWDQASALRMIVSAQAEAGQINAAQVTTGQIEHAWERASALAKIASAQAQAGAFTAAAATAGQIKDVEYRSKALEAIASAQAEAGQINAAKATAGQIEDAKNRASVLMAIANALAEAGAFDAVQETWERAIAVAGQIEDVEYRSEALMAIASVQAEAGAFAAAEATAGQIEDAKNRASALMAIASAQTEAGAFDAASEIWERAIAVAGQIKDANDRASALMAIASTQAEIGAFDAAHETCERAIVVAGQIKDANDRASALMAIASTQAEIGAFDAAEVTASQIEDAGFRASALMAIVLSKVQRGEYHYTFLLHYNTEIPDLINLIYAYRNYNQPHIAHICVCDFWRVARRRDVLINRLPLIIPLIVTHQELIQQLIDSFTWVDEQLKLT